MTAKFSRCVLHIGTPKTGSTTLQSFIQANRDRLAERGVWAPRSLGRNHVRLCVSMMRPDRRDGNAPRVLHIQRAPDIPTLARRVTEAFDAETAAAFGDGPRPATLLITSEFFQQFLNEPDEIARLADWLLARAERVEPLLYVRRQADYVVSMASTRMKDSGVDFPMRFPDGTPRHLRYEDADALYSSAFGAEGMRVRVYERGALKDGDLIPDFLDALGLAPWPGMVRPAPENLSIRPELQKFLAHINRLAPPFVKGAPNPERIELGALHARFQGRGVTPTPEEARAFTERFAAGNEELRARYHPDRPRLFSDDYSAFENGPSAHVTDDDLMKVCHEALRIKEAEIRRLRARLALAEGRPQDARAEALAARALDPLAPLDPVLSRILEQEEA